MYLKNFLKKKLGRSEVGAKKMWHFNLPHFFSLQLLYRVQHSAG